MVQLEESAVVLEAILPYCYPQPVDDATITWPYFQHRGIIRVLDKYFVRPIFLWPRSRADEDLATLARDRSLSDGVRDSVLRSLLEVQHFR